VIQAHEVRAHSESQWHQHDERVVDRVEPILGEKDPDRYRERERKKMIEILFASRGSFSMAISR
jgi:hypothetical protein